MSAMKTSLGLAFAAVMLAIATSPAAWAQGRPPRPWCEYSSAYGAGPDCSYATYAQCMATARGDGTCQRNPRFDWPYFQRGIPAPVDVDPYGRPLRAPQR
jgi:hypothetical protein